MEQCDIVSNEMKTFAHRLVFLHWSLVLLTTVSFHFEHRCLVRRKFYSNPGKGECTEVCDKTNYNVVYKAPIKSPQCPHSRQHNITAAMTGLTRELGSSTRYCSLLIALSSYNPHWNYSNCNVQILVMGPTAKPRLKCVGPSAHDRDKGVVWCGWVVGGCVVLKVY